MTAPSSVRAPRASSPVVAASRPAKTGRSRGVYRFRSAVTGRWVTAGYARRYPHLTVRHQVR